MPVDVINEGFNIGIWDKNFSYQSMDKKSLRLTIFVEFNTNVFAEKIWLKNSDSALFETFDASERRNLIVSVVTCDVAPNFSVEIVERERVHFHQRDESFLGFCAAVEFFFVTL